VAVYYVYSGAGGSNNGSSWANAFTTLTLAFATEVAGDTLYVAHDHSESTGSSITLASSGTVANPTKVVCVDRAGTVPPVSADRRATAQVATTSTSSINFTGFTHFDGIIFVAGNSSSINNIVIPNGNSTWMRFDNCSLRIGSTSSSSKVSILNSGTYVELTNTTFSFAQVGQSIQINGAFKWRNTASALLGTIPTTLITLPGLTGGWVDVAGVDLSAAASGKTICGTIATAHAIKCRFLDCKLNASVTKSTVPAAHGANEVDFVRSGSAGVNYTVHSHRTSGLLTEETAIVRSGGASDGTTPLSWKVVTTANCNYSMPFECPPIVIWNDTTGSSVTATVEGIASALPTDAEVWLDVEYLGDASSPQGSFVNDGKADLLATAANQTTSSETWGGSTSAFKMACTFTPQQEGWVYARVKIGKASSTIYIDPMVTLS
jgi:hypothetical protein